MMLYFLYATDEPLILKDNIKSDIEVICPNFMGPCFETSLTYRHDAAQPEVITEPFTIRPCLQPDHKSLYFAYRPTEEHQWIAFFDRLHPRPAIGIPAISTTNIHPEHDQLFINQEQRIFGIGPSFGYPQPQFDFSSDSESDDDALSQVSTSDTEYSAMMHQTFADVIHSIPQPNKYSVARLLDTCAKNKRGNQKTIADLTHISLSTIHRLKNPDKHPRSHKSPSLQQFWAWLSEPDTLKHLMDLSGKTEADLIRIIA